MLRADDQLSERCNLNFNRLYAERKNDEPFIETPTRQLGRLSIGVDNRDYHYLSQCEIASAKRISQHLSNFPPGFTEDYLRVADHPGVIRWWPESTCRVRPLLWVAR